MCTNLARITSIASNMPERVADDCKEKFKDIGYSCHELITSLVCELIASLHDDHASSN